MTRRKAVAQKEHTLAPERALQALRRQLEGLQKLKNRSCEEAKLEETEWKNFTHNIGEGVFGNSSTHIPISRSSRSRQPPHDGHPGAAVSDGPRQL